MQGDRNGARTYREVVIVAKCKPSNHQTPRGCKRQNVRTEKEWAVLRLEHDHASSE
jgi:hypothetical protein